MLVATELGFRLPNAKTRDLFVAKQTPHEDECTLPRADLDVRRGFVPNMHSGAMPAG